MSFTTASPGVPPAVTTIAATSVGATNATMNGSVLPNGLATNAWFEWGTDPALSSYSTTVTQPMGSGAASQPVSASLSGLSTGTNYYFRVAANNSSGMSRGTIVSFTPGAAPTVTTLAATSVSATGATLNGNVTPNGLATNAWFEWGTDSGLATFSSTSTQPVGSGTTSQSVNEVLTGLFTGTTFYYRIAASNSSGTTKGGILSFTPSTAPTVITLAAPSVGTTGATLNGSVTPNGLATNAWFEWGTDSALLVTFSSTPTQSIGSGTTSQSVNAELSGLSTGTTYYYRVAASNISGTTKGSIMSFTPGAAPTVITLSATWHDATSLGLNGSVLPNGLATDVWFEWGTDSGLVTFSTTMTRPFGSGTTSQLFWWPLSMSGLSSGTTYFFRIAASNISGTSKGSILSFIPGSGTWSVTASMATARSGHTATLLPNGKVLVVGGIGGGSIFSSAELYDPATGTWTATGSMTELQSGHTATLLQNGKVLVAGGGSVNRFAAELYDPATGTWSATGSMTAVHSGHTATLLQNGKVLVAGGYSAGENNTELYDPATGTWSATSGGIGSRMGHTATLLPNDKVLVTGGNVIGNSLSSAVLIDPETETWSATGFMAEARNEHTATLLQNGRVLVAAGVESKDSGPPPLSLYLSSAEIFDPETETWSATGFMAEARNDHTATLLQNGRVLVAGGRGGLDTFSSAELFDPGTGIWSTTALMWQARRSYTATLLPDGKVLVAGGYADGDILSSAELYIPGSGE